VGEDGQGIARGKGKMGGFKASRSRGVSLEKRFSVFHWADKEKVGGGQLPEKEVCNSQVGGDAETRGKFKRPYTRTGTPRRIPGVLPGLWGLGSNRKKENKKKNGR